MTRIPRRLLSWSIVAIPLVFAGCDSNHTRIAVGSGLASPSAIVSARLLPEALPLLPVATFGCPLVHPFLTEFDLIVDGRGTDFFLDRVLFEFGEGGAIVPPMILSPLDLRGRFGDTIIRAGSSRAFRFQQPFGCGFGFAPRSLGLRGTLVSRFGATHQFTLTAPIR